MKNILGGVAAPPSGGGCCAHTEGWTSSRCDYPDAASAQAAASAVTVSTGVRTFYCCSCPAHTVAS